jgi:hypothetical protein
LALDLLFVVDNSHSMAEEQANIGRNFPDFMRELQAIEQLRPLISGVSLKPAMIVSSHRGADRVPFRRSIEWRLRGAPAGVKQSVAHGGISV